MRSIQISLEAQEPWDVLKIQLLASCRCTSYDSYVSVSILRFSNLWKPQVTLPQGNAPFHSSVGPCSNSPQSFSSNEPSNAFNMSIHFPSHFNFLDVKQPKAQQTIEINRLITKDHATGSPLGSLEQGLPEGLPLSWTFLSGVSFGASGELRPDIRWVSQLGG